MVLLSKEKRRTLQFVREHDLFEADWYSAAHGLSATSQNDLWNHFETTGFQQKLSPFPLFDGTFYRSIHPDLQQVDVHPLYHYLFFGSVEGRQPHPYLQPGFLNAALGDDAHPSQIVAFRQKGGDLGPRPVFDIPFLRSFLGLPDQSSGWEVMSAYARHPARHRIAPHPMFDAIGLHEVLDLSADECAIDRFLSRDEPPVAPHPLFNMDYLRAHNPLAPPEIEGLTEFEKVLLDPGLANFDFTDLFDNAHYLAQKPGIADQSPFIDYLAAGWRDGLDPHPMFDQQLYRQRFLGENDDHEPLTHYARYGKEPHITLSPRFNQAYYLSRYPSVKRDYLGTALEHYLRHGLAEGCTHRNDGVWRDDFSSWGEVKAEIETKLAEPEDAPEVSVVIPVYNQFQYTLRAVWSILRAGDHARLQIIIADDQSTDETETFFSGITGLTYIRNPENLGFLRSCNNAAESAKAPFLYFLNNDTAVLPNWIDSAVQTMQRIPDAGLVGSKLIYPDGTLQEAGGYIWSDASGANAGRGGDPRASGFNFLRDVDYVSGAGILVRRDVWAEMGGFDQHYAPAYCEDSDLAMRLRGSGWRVLYQPRSEIVHFEGISSGRDLTSGVKAYQVENQRKLRRRWEFALEAHAPSQAVDSEDLTRPGRPRMLVIDAMTPEPDKDAGSVTAFWFLKLFVELGYDVSFMPCNLLLNGKYGRALQELGVQVLHHPCVTSISDYIDANSSQFDLFFLYRYAEGGAFAKQIRAVRPDAKIIFDTVDLHHLRMMREARFSENPAEAMASAHQVKAQELAVAGIADDTILLSTAELEILRDEDLDNAYSVIPLVLENGAVPTSTNGRSGIAFVGGFRHIPNVTAVEFFLEAIWPTLHAADPELEFHIVGSNPPPEILDLQEDGVVVHGFIEDLDEFLDQRLATVAPLQYGAGIKGKIGSSMAAGVPCISTPIGIEGMGLTPGEDVLVAERADEFVAAVASLKSDPNLWSRISRAGQDFVERNYSPCVTKGRLQRLLAKNDVAPFGGVCPFTGDWEARRFLSENDPASLSGSAGSQIHDRLLMHALQRVGQNEPSQVQAHVHDAPFLENWLASKGAAIRSADAAEIALVRLCLAEDASQALTTILSQLGPDCTKLAIALTPIDCSVAEPDFAPTIVHQMVEVLRAAGWETRLDRWATPECALTGCALLEARRQK